MARPKKTDNEQQAKTRLVNAFWRLLKEHDFHSISIAMLCREAKCTRGTFYYHFSDIDNLIEYVVESEFLHNRFPQLIFNILSGTGDDTLAALASSEWPQHIALLTREGSNVLLGKIKNYVLRVWQAVLCSNGGTMSDQTRLIIEYQSSAMVNMLSYIGEESMKGHRMELPTAFLSSVSRTAILQICAAEGLSEDILRERLAMVNQMSKLMEA
ncbi:MAG: TetR/AcrR family transcriptional regulator [Eggerthellaceae bacterium]